MYLKIKLTAKGYTIRSDGNASHIRYTSVLACMFTRAKYFCRFPVAEYTVVLPSFMHVGQT